MNCSGDRHGARAERIAQGAERFAERVETRRQTRAERWDPPRSRDAALRRARREADRRTNHQVLGAVLLAVGGNWLLAELGLFPFGWPGLLAVGLVTLGLSMMGTAKAGRTMPLMILGAVMAMLLATTSGVSGQVDGTETGRNSRIENLGELVDLRFEELRERLDGRVGEIRERLEEVEESR